MAVNYFECFKGQCLLVFVVTTFRLEFKDFCCTHIAVSVEDERYGELYALPSRGRFFSLMNCEFCFKPLVLSFRVV